MACDRCGKRECGNAPKPTAHVSDIPNMTSPVLGHKGDRPEPTPFGTWRYPASKDPYAENLRYGLATGILASSQLRQIGLDTMAFVPHEPSFVQTERGLMIVGTNTSSPPKPRWPYSPNSPVILALAYGLKHRLLTFDQVRALGLEPFYIRPLVY